MALSKVSGKLPEEICFLCKGETFSRRRCSLFTGLSKTKTALALEEIIEEEISSDLNRTVLCRSCGGKIDTLCKRKKEIEEKVRELSVLFGTKSSQKIGSATKRKLDCKENTTDVPAAKYAALAEEPHRTSYISLVFMK